MSLHTGWPWAGIAIAPILLVILFFTDLLRGDRSLPRWKDPVWLAWLVLPVYMIHQFEEHGIDAMGRPYAFRASICGIFGFPDADSCPIPEAFLTAVNLSVVWAATVFSALGGRRRPRLAAAIYGVPIVNGVTHVAPAILQQRYNPGVVTALVLFLPLGVWAMRTFLADPSVGRNGAFRAMLAGVVVHVVLMGSLVLFVRGVIGEDLLIAVNIANAGVPAIVALGGASGRVNIGRAAA
jgi:hypothetical protein